MQVKAVATALGIHPCTLSKWRKDVHDGTLRGRLPKAAPPGPARAIARLQQLERATYGVARLCRGFGVTRAGYYAWRRRHPSAHAVQDRTLLEQIRTLFTQHHGLYGSPRIHDALQTRGIAVSGRSRRHRSRDSSASLPGTGRVKRDLSVPPEPALADRALRRPLATEAATSDGRRRR